MQTPNLVLPFMNCLVIFGKGNLALHFVTVAAAGLAFFEPEGLAFFEVAAGSGPSLSELSLSEALVAAAGLFWSFF